MKQIRIPHLDGLGDEDFVAVLVAQGMDELDALAYAPNGHGNSPTVIGRRGDPIPIDESEIDTWLSWGSFG